MTDTSSNLRRSTDLLFSAFALTILLLALACGPHKHDEQDHEEHGHDDEPGHHDEHGHADEHAHADEHGHSDGDSWAVTAFGEHYEIFAEANPLIASTDSTTSATSRSHTHVTVLDGFAPLLEGRVEAILSPAGQQAPAASDPAFVQTTAVRPGIFDIELTPRTAGTFQLFFRVSSDDTTGARSQEVIDAGQVTVGTPEAPGELISTPFAPEGEGDASFLKEQQWQTSFATAWARAGTLADSVHGPAVVIPPAGGEVVLTAPVDGVLTLARRDSWPYTGAEVDQRQTLFVIVPRRTDAKTPAALEGEISGLRAQLDTARARLGNLEQLLELQAVSQREVDEARTRVVTLEADLQARQQDLRAEEAARRGGAGAAGIVLRAPFDARIASVDVSPGETVAAGTTLARLVARGPVWVEVRLQPQDAVRLRPRPTTRDATQEATPEDTNIETGLLLRPAGSDRTLELTGDAVRLVTLHPEVDARSGTVGAVFEVGAPPPQLLPGVRAEAEVLLPTTPGDPGAQRQGVLIPRTALVDDAGVDTVFVQLDGESFERREVTVLARQGDQLLISGVDAGERLVTLGGAAIRRASLLESGGGDHGHVH